MKTYRTMAWTTVMMASLALVACGGGAAEEPAGDGGTGAAASAAAPSRSASGGGTTCRQLGVANHVATFSSCSDDDVRVLFCRQKSGGYDCECKQGPMMEEETLKTERIEEGTPFEFTLADIQVLHGNATEAAQRICGFEIEHPCDGTS